MQPLSDYQIRPHRPNASQLRPLVLRYVFDKMFLYKMLQKSTVLSCHLVFWQQRGRGNEATSSSCRFSEISWSAGLWITWRLGCHGRMRLDDVASLHCFYCVKNSLKLWNFFAPFCTETYCHTCSTFSSAAGLSYKHFSYELIAVFVLFYRQN